ncbi:cysteine synthase B [Photobacterium aphoticum]|uniref:Cysteine synthase B n=1 Tax=Photobacterium aphoticum TaxID=754436 RepID=A0A090QRP5_9GAMM|nr:cysteine synthase B [Photobacterium aphoticum]
MIGRKAGASTGTNLYGALQLACEMKAKGETGSIVTLLCDSGERYLDTYFDRHWVAEHIGDIDGYLAQLQHLEQTGEWSA